jgi:hypothetical protein
LNNVYRSLAENAKLAYDFQKYSRYNTRGLINCMEAEVSNFFFKKPKASMVDGLMIFLVKSRSGI